MIWFQVFLFITDNLHTVISFLCNTNNLYTILCGGCPSGVMVKAMDCRIIVSELVLQSRYYIHFRTNTFGKGMNPLILPAMG